MTFSASHIDKLNLLERIITHENIFLNRCSYTGSNKEVIKSVFNDFYDVRLSNNLKQGESARQGELKTTCVLEADAHVIADIIKDCQPISTDNLWTIYPLRKND